MASGANSGLRPLTWQSRASHTVETAPARPTREGYPSSDSGSGHSRSQQAQPRQRREVAAALRDNQAGEEPSSRGRESRPLEDNDRVPNAQEAESQAKQNGTEAKKQIIIKIGILGESQSGKSSLLVSKGVVSPTT